MDQGFFYRTADDLWGEVWKGALASPGVSVPKRNTPIGGQFPPMTQFVGDNEVSDNQPQIPGPPQQQPPIIPQQPPPVITKQLPTRIPQRLPTRIPQQPPPITPPSQPLFPMKPLKPFVFFSAEDNNLPSFNDFSQQPQQQPPSFVTQPPVHNVDNVVLPNVDNVIFPTAEEVPDYLDFPNFDFEKVSGNSDSATTVPNQFSVLDSLNPDPQEYPQPDATPLVTLEEAILANTFVTDVPNLIENNDDPIYQDYQDYLDSQPAEQPAEPQTIKLTAVQKGILKNAGMTEIPDEINKVAKPLLQQVINIFAQEESNLPLDGDGNQLFEVVDLSKSTDQNQPLN